MLTVDGDPLVKVLPLRQHDGLPQVPAAQRGLGVFQQLVLVRALWDVLLGLEGFGRATATRREERDW